MMIHVDDVLVTCNPDGWAWFSAMARTHLTMNSEDPFRFNSGETLYYLKKKVMLARQGVFIQRNLSHIKKMVELLELEGKKAKCLPHRSSLEVYSKDETKDSERPADFPLRSRTSALHSTRTTRHPTSTEDAFDLHGRWNKTRFTALRLRHLASYLSGTQEAGFLLMQTKTYQITSENWDYPAWSNRQDRQPFNLEAFTDASWAGCKVLRKSTTSYMIFMNGNLLISSCKLQSSIALSSAESELYASCSGNAYFCTLAIY